MIIYYSIIEIQSGIRFELLILLNKIMHTFIHECLLQWMWDILWNQFSFAVKYELYYYF